MVNLELLDIIFYNLAIIPPLRDFDICVWNFLQSSISCSFKNKHRNKNEKWTDLSSFINFLVIFYEDFVSLDQSVLEKNLKWNYLFPSEGSKKSILPSSKLYLAIWFKAISR